MFCTEIGIPNANTEKKERMLSDEVNRMQGGVFASRYSATEARKQACIEINKMFGLNIDVEFRQENQTDNGEESEDNKDE